MIGAAIDGSALNDPDGRWSVLDETDVVNGIAANVVSQTVPGMDGAVPVPETLGEPVKTYVMLVEGASDLDVKRNLSALMSLFRNGSALSRSVDDDSQTVVCKFKDAQRPTFFPDGSATVVFTLRLPGVYWRATAPDWSRTAPASGTAYEVTTLAGSTAPVDDALLLVTGPVAQPRVTCAGRWVELALTLAAGEKALIDCASWVVRRGTGVTFAGGGTVTSGSVITSGGPYLLRLMPSMRAADPVDTWVTVALSGSGFTSATALGVRARPAFLV